MSFVRFPEGAAQGSVPDEVLVRFAIVEPAVLLVLQAASLLAVIYYPITRAQHEVNLRKIAERDAAAANAVGGD